MLNNNEIKKLKSIVKFDTNKEENEYIEKNLKNMLKKLDNLDKFFVNKNMYNNKNNDYFLED